MQRNHLFIKAAGLHCYRRTTCRDTEREMNRSARRKMLKAVGIIMVVMLPVMLALWFAQLRAVSEISAQLRTFAELALNKTERVIQQVDMAREDAEKYQGKVCTPEHRQYMLNVSRGRLFVADLMLKARTFSARPFLRRIILTSSPLPITHVNPTLLSIIFAIRHFLMVIK